MSSIKAIVTVILEVFIEDDGSESLKAQAEAAAKRLIASSDGEAKIIHIKDVEVG